MLAALLWSGSAAAANVSKPVAPASFTAVDCLTTVVRAGDPEVQFDIAIPFEDVGTTPDEPPGSRHMQFFATCRDVQPGERMPTWISRADAESAAVVDPTVIGPSSDDVLEESAAWSGPGHGGEGSPCVIAINASDDRMPITCEATAEGIVWDTTGVPPGAYVVWGYTYEGARSVWSRRPGVVHVVDDGPETAPPAIAFSSPAARGEMHLESGLLVQGCAAGALGTTVELSWATLGDLAADPTGAWESLAQVDVGPFEVPFVPLQSAEYAAVVFRAVVDDPARGSFQMFSTDYMTVLPGCDPPTGAEPAIADACGVSDGDDTAAAIAARGCDAPTDPEVGDGSGDGSSEDGGDASSSGPTGDDADTDTDAGAIADDPSCACTSDRGEADRPWALVLVLLARIRRRIRRRAARRLVPLAILRTACGGTRDYGRGGGLGLHGDASVRGRQVDMTGSGLALVALPPTG